MKHALMAATLMAMLLFGACDHHGSESMTRVGDVEAGKAVFVNNCATCHGASGVEGGVGPSLRGEWQRKNMDATIAWVKNPAPPMPHLYPSLLTDRQVEDVASYVNSL